MRPVHFSRQAKVAIATIYQSNRIGGASSQIALQSQEVMSSARRKCNSVSSSKQKALPSMQYLGYTMVCTKPIEKHFVLSWYCLEIRCKGKEPFPVDLKEIKLTQKLWTFREIMRSARLWLRRLFDCLNYKTLVI